MRRIVLAALAALLASGAEAEFAGPSSGLPVISVGNQAGSDLGAQINAAIALCPSAGCTIDARGLTGSQTLSTAVTLGTGQSLLIGSATIAQSATITVGTTASIVCQPNGFGQGNNFGPSLFRQANGANLQNMLLVSGGQASAQWCVFDGNKTNNASSGPVVAVSGGHFLLDKLTVQNGAADGVMIYSGSSEALSGSPSYAYGTANGACCGTIRDVMSAVNSGDGYDCGGTADVIFEGSQAENNAGNAGVELNNCPAWRLSEYDIGGNQIGLWAHGAAYSSGVSLGAYSLMIGVGQFGNQAKQDVLLDSSAGASYYNQIVGAELFATSYRTSNAYASIEIIESTGSAGPNGNIITGDGFFSTASHAAASAVFIHGAQGASAPATASFTSGSSTTLSVGTVTGTIAAGQFVYDTTTGSPVGYVSSYSAGAVTLTTAALSTSSGAADALVFYAGTTGYDTVGPAVANGVFGGSAIYDVGPLTQLNSACANAVCQNLNQSYVGATFTKSPTGTYGATVASAGTSAADAYTLAVTNPSSAAYATVYEDVFVGPPGSGVQLGERSCQRYSTGSYGTCARYTYNSSGTKILAAVEGGAVPSESGCSAGSFLGGNTTGQFSLTAACTASTITLTFWTAAAHGWTCPALQDQTSGAQFPQTTGGSTTTAVFKGTGASGDVLTYGPCYPY
jgi:hypothetical protein